MGWGYFSTVWLCLDLRFIHYVAVWGFTQISSSCHIGKAPVWFKQSLYVQVGQASGREGFEEWRRIHTGWARRIDSATLCESPFLSLFFVFLCFLYHFLILTPNSSLRAIGHTWTTLFALSPHVIFLSLPLIHIHPCFHGSLFFFLVSYRPISLYLNKYSTSIVRTLTLTSLTRLCLSPPQASGPTARHLQSRRIVQLLDEFKIAGVNGVRILP